MIPIRLEGANGGYLLDANYDAHDLLRPFQIAYGGQWYEQNRKDQDVWVYRQRATPLGTMANDPNLQVDALQIASLAPASAVLGDPSFTLHVLGTRFNDTTVIVFGGQEEPTTLITENNVSTGVNMAMWQGPDPAIPVYVRNAAGAVSNTLTFAMLASAAQTATKTAWPLPGWDANG